jgi:hypothetical protein
VKLADIPQLADVSEFAADASFAQVSMIICRQQFGRDHPNHSIYLSGGLGSRAAPRALGVSCRGDTGALLVKRYFST